MTLYLLETATIIAAMILLADFLSGLFHWLEDSYGDESWPLIGRFVTQANVLHHFDPRHMTTHSWFASARVPLALAAGCLAFAYAVGVLTWPAWLLAFLTVNSNEVHKWAHKSRAENGRLIAFVQSLGVIQSRGHHAKHHQGLKDTGYCVLTNWLNPILDGLHVWRALEKLVEAAIGVSKRKDPSLGYRRREYVVPACTNRACIQRAGGL